MAVLHELSYVLPRYVKQMTRRDVGDYLLMILSWPGVRADKDVLVETAHRWRGTAGLGFVDAYLVTLAGRRAAPLYTKNVRELRAQGVDVPDPLPGPRRRE